MEAVLEMPTKTTTTINPIQLTNDQWCGVAIESDSPVGKCPS